MKIQELAIIFIIIILPISIVLAEYTQFQIKTLNTQSVYDAKLTSATYDAIKAFQLNAKNESYSDIVNVRGKNVEAGVNAFRNSIMTTFKLNGYTEEQLDNYIPALVYTLYDGFYIYSPYNNINHRYEDSDPETEESITIIEPTATDVKADGNKENLYGIKPYINYSCRYVTPGIDVVITYALDNYVTVQGIIGGIYYNKSGYLIDNISCSADDEADNDFTIDYNGVSIEEEKLYENVGDYNYPYAKENGIKNYLVGNQIKNISNGEITVKESEASDESRKKIESNDSAKQYYKDAYFFTKWFKNSGLQNLTYSDAVDEVIGEEGDTELTNIWGGDTRKIFDFNTFGGNINNNIENELSSFNQHRLSIIRHKIETNLAIAIANYNSYSGAANVFQMPELKEDEWDQITHNISLISFLQGLPIGGKIYNGYTLVTNSESEEVILENNIYILGNDGAYHRIGDKTLNIEDRIVVNSSGTCIEDKRSAGRLNLDFKRATLVNNNGIEIYYYYPLKEYNASYNSIVMQNDVDTYDDIYAYVATQGDDLKTAFYTALGRERAGKYNVNTIVDAGHMRPGGSSESTTSVYTITYNANGGSVTPSTQSVAAGSTVTLPTPTRSGHNFLGWSASTGGTYWAGANYTVNGNVTFVANWDTIMYTVTYNANGGSVTPESQTVDAGGTITLPIPEKTGYNFTGWSASTGGTYWAGVNYTVNGNVTFTANWEVATTPVIRYTITYDANGGTGGPSAQDVTEGQTAIIPADIPTKKRTINLGFYKYEVDVKFLGWSIIPEASNAQYKPGDQITPNESMILYAVWEGEGTSEVLPVNSYMIKYNANGGSGGPGSQTVVKGQTATIPSTVPTKRKFMFISVTFLGWRDENGNIYQPGGTITPTQDMTLYAVWDE